MKIYPSGTVRRLLETDLVTEPTRAALRERLKAVENYEPRFFDAKLFVLLRRVCERLIPQSANSVDCAAYIDSNFSEGKSNGWRYDALPEKGETFKRGLRGILETANAKFQTNFIELNAERQDEILTEIQNDTATGETWKTLDAELFFEELLASATEVYYSHPLAQEEIGYVGMADAPGWKRVGLNELETREPRASDETKE